MIYKHIPLANKTVYLVGVPETPTESMSKHDEIILELQDKIEQLQNELYNVKDIVFKKIRYQGIPLGDALMQLLMKDE